MPLWSSTTPAGGLRDAHSSLRWRKKPSRHGKTATQSESMEGQWRAHKLRTSPLKTSARRGAGSGKGMKVRSTEEATGGNTTSACGNNARVRKRSRQQHATGSDQASPPITAKVNVSVQWLGRRNNASTAVTERTMNANKGTAEEGRVPGIANGNKRPGCEQMHQRKRKQGRAKANVGLGLSLIHISEPTRPY